MLSDPDIKTLRAARDILDTVYADEDNPKSARNQASLGADKITAVLAVAEKRMRVEARRSLMGAKATKGETATDEAYEEA